MSFIEYKVGYPISPACLSIVDTEFTANIYVGKRFIYDFIALYKGKQDIAYNLALLIVWYARTYFYDVNSAVNMAKTNLGIVDCNQFKQYEVAVNETVDKLMLLL